MGKHTYFELKGWRQSGRGLGATAKAEIQDLLLDIGADDCGSDCDPLDAFVMSFCHDSFSAYDNVKAILSGYAENVPAWTFGQLIHDVLSAENIGHWIVTPTHTFHI